MTEHSQRRGAEAGVVYAENRSAVRSAHFAHIAVWVIVLIAGIALLAVNPGLGIVCVVGLIGALVAISLTVANWPVGIVVDGSGIRIGGVSRAARGTGDLPRADQQRKQVLFAPWDAVRHCAVITDKSVLHDAADMRNAGGRVVKIGVMWAPFAKAGLLIEVDPDRVVVPRFKEADDHRTFWRPAHRGVAKVSPVWYVPTRRPEDLRAALAQYAGYLGGPPDPRLPAYLRLLLERAGAA
jgi:hypothetical protein